MKQFFDFLFNKFKRKHFQIAKEKRPIIVYPVARVTKNLHTVNSRLVKKSPKNNGKVKIGN